MQLAPVTEKLSNSSDVDHLSLFTGQSSNRQNPQLQELLLASAVHEVVSDWLSRVFILLQCHVLLGREVFPSVHVLHSGWKFLCQESGDVDVIDPEERRGLRSVVEQR